MSKFDKEKKHSGGADSDAMRKKKRELLGSMCDINSIPDSHSMREEMEEQNEYLEGAKVRIDDIVDEDIVIFDARIGRSKFTDENNAERKLLTLQFGKTGKNLMDETFIVFTSSNNLIQFIENGKKNRKKFFPFRTRIRHFGMGYSFE